MPASAVAGLCRVFEEQVVIPWRSLEAKGNLCFASIIFQYCQITWPLSERDQQSLKLALRHDSLPKVQFATKTLPKDFSEQAERGRPYLPVESVLAPNLM